MIKRVLILGGYGNFGGFIAKTLARDHNIRLILAGRSLGKAQDFSRQLDDAAHKPECIAIDITQNFPDALAQVNPDIVIHTSGPFQSQDYDVARACINHGCHYIDLADAREFVANITSLHADAVNKQVTVISGASSVPCLTSALVDHYYPQFARLDTLDYAITTAQKTTRGLATTAAVLGYTGRPFQTLVNGAMKTIYGWQGLRARRYKNLGWRLLGYCDIPDLSLFPRRYSALKTIRFYAGIEIKLIHMGLWGLSWLVRAGLIKNLQNAAPFLLKTSFLFDRLGSNNSAFHMTLSGTGHDDTPKTITFELTARNGDGPYIPCMPAILLTRKLAAGELQNHGAYPCMGLVTRDEYLNALGKLDIDWQEYK